MCGDYFVKSVNTFLAKKQHNFRRPIREVYKVYILISYEHDIVLLYAKMMTEQWSGGPLQRGIMHRKLYTQSQEQFVVFSKTPQIGASSSFEIVYSTIPP